MRACESVWPDCALPMELPVNAPCQPLLVHRPSARSSQRETQCVCQSRHSLFNAPLPTCSSRKKEPRAMHAIPKIKASPRRQANSIFVPSRDSYFHFERFFFRVQYNVCPFCPSSKNTLALRVHNLELP